MNPGTSDFVLQLRCSADASFQVATILQEMKIQYKLIERARLAPVVDQVIYELILSVASAALVDLLAKLFKRLWDKKIHIEYESRYEAARAYLKDREPLVPLSRLDREDFSEYVFKTRNSKFKWMYDRGAINCGPEK